MTLQDTFYTIGIIYMVLMFALFIALLVAVLVIKAKIDKAHALVNEKVSQVKSMVDKATVGLKTVKYFVKR